MTEKEFIEEAKKRGLTDHSIQTAIFLYEKKAVDFLNDNLITASLEVQNRPEKRDDDFVSLD